MVIAMGFIPQMALETPRNIGFVDEAGILQASDNFTKFDHRKGSDVHTIYRVCNDINADFIGRSSGLRTRCEPRDTHDLRYHRD